MISEGSKGSQNVLEGSKGSHKVLENSKGSQKVLEGSKGYLREYHSFLLLKIFLTWL
jgi:hypothetical protein